MFASNTSHSAEQLDAQFNYVTMLLPGNGTNGAQNNTFLDSSTNNFTITRNGNTTQGTFSPYGSNWSNYFDGTGDYLASASIGAISGDFTMECWAFISGSGDQSLFGMGTAAVSGGFFVRYEGNTVPQNLNFYTTTDNLFNVSLTRDTWYHIAFTRQSNSIKCWVNGTQVGSAITISDSFTSAAFYAGAGKVGSTVPYNPLTGYISNLRVVAGTALYTSAFTPSTTPLTAVSGTSLLTCQSNRFIDNSTNGYAITRNGDVSVQRFSPFNPTTPYAAGTIGGSGYFDGTTDYLSVADNNALDFGTGDFTVECWCYVNNALTTQTTLFSVGSYNAGLLLRINGGSSDELYINGSYWAVPFSTYMQSYAWAHVAVVRSGTSLAVFVNGSRALSTTSSANIAPTTNTTIGAATHDTTQDMNGYLSDFRVVKGTAVYSPSSSTVTIPTAPLTAITNTSLLCNFTNAGIIDNAMMNDLETVGNAQISTSVKKYGTGSLAFDGTGDVLISKELGAAFTYGTGDYTIEFWIYPTTGATNQRTILGRENTGDVSVPYIYLKQTSGYLALYYSSDIASTSSAIAQNTWTHIAVCRSSGTTRIFVNGTQDGSGADTTNLISPNFITIGASGSGASVPFTGYIDDLRITKGYARYTANFTPPTAAFPNN